MSEKKSSMAFSDAFKPYESAFASPFAEDNPFSKWLSEMALGNLDPQQLVKEHQDRLESLTRANQEAASAFQAHIRRQAEIFDAMMKSAKESANKMDVSGTPEDAQKNLAIYSDAVETATRLMQQLSEETAAASAEAYRKILGEVEAATKSMQSR